MSKRIRTFIAIDVNPAIRRKLVALQDELRAAVSDVKWVEPDNLHLTMKFLGEVAETELYAVCKLAARAVAAMPAFSIGFCGVGAFPNPSKPRVIWAGVREGANELAAIHDSLERAFVADGYPREDRDFTPHLTLGRTRHAQPTPRLAATLAELADWELEGMPASELLVMSSQLTADGPSYGVMGRGQFTGRLAQE